MKPKNSLKRFLSGALMSSAILFGAALNSHAVTFDPDGGGPVAAIDVGTFDWLPTSFLALNGATAAQNFVNSGGTCPANSCNFDVLVHAKLGATVSPGGVVNTPTGLNTNYEITLVARFTETVTGIATVGPQSVATFATVTGAPAFLEIYFDSTPDTVDVSGSGFNNGDLILRGTVVGAANGTFSTNIASLTAPVKLDQHNTNDYGPNDAPPSACTPGVDQCTVTGSGSQDNIPVNALVQDFAFFQQLLAAFGVEFANISQGLPFISVTPSDCFTPSQSGIAVAGGGTTGEPPTVCTNSHVDGLMSANAANGGVLPVIGNVNGAFVGGGPDFVAQTDFNSVLQAAVPEPASFLLFGFGLLGVGGYLRSRSRRNK